MSELNVTDSELDKFESRIQKVYASNSREVPVDVRERIMDQAAVVAQQIKNRISESALYEDEFILLAAADENEKNTRELISKTGSWKLESWESVKNPDKGKLVLSVNTEQLEQWEGKNIKLVISGELVISGPIIDGEIEADVDFSELDMSGSVLISR